MYDLTASVLLPSRRPAALVRCLQGLAAQTRPPEDVCVVWQGDDTATRDSALSMAGEFGTRLHVVHCPEVGIVPAENTALAHATGDIILLIDDDAVAPPTWLARCLAYYADPSVGAVGGPADNFTADGTPFPRRSNEPIGQMHWSGRLSGNMFDHVEAWRTRTAIDVDHLIGGNLSLRRSAFDRFETGLKPYWQFFELEVCLQVKSRGFRVVFDFDIVVQHFPTNPVFVAGRDGDLTVKIYNPAYNQAFILGRYTTGLRRLASLAYLFGVGTSGGPGLIGSIYCMAKYGHMTRELKILRQTLANRVAGWKAGSELHRTQGLAATLKKRGVETH